MPKVDDHPHFASGPMRELFDAFRKQVLALDPCVSEEVLKLWYVVYKTETNFVYVVPQARRLLISLNVAFHEVDDLRGICKDLSLPMAKARGFLTPAHEYPPVSLPLSAGRT